MQEIWTALAARGGEEYGGEAVTMLQHGLQCAALAEREGAGDVLVTAGLLHDIGHMVDVPEGENIETLANKGIDAEHEDVGALFLRQWYGDDVIWPIRHHVAAKRYLCLRKPGYMDELSPASVKSLNLQGGPFTDDEASEFLKMPFAHEGVRLRIWDDLGKDPEMETPPLEHFIEIAERVARA
ncbi:MAG: HD domain-containing protein [Pseudomonadota bacterium]